MIGSKIKIGIMLAMVTALVTLGWLYREELQRGAEQAATIMQQKAEIQDKDKRIRDLARQRQAAEAIAAREKARAVEIRQEARRLKDEIARLEQENQTVEHWADTRMPGALYERLRAATADCSD
jgi:LysB family phage lysis regulatory protein